MSFSTPVAFIIFNRPDLTQMVFESIARAKPEKLFVVADGPRFPEEAEKCEQARAVTIFPNTYGNKNRFCDKT